MRSRIDDAEVRGAILRQANRFGISTIAISANYAIASGAAQVQIINSGASTNRNVTLPASPKKGDFFFIINAGSGTSTLTIQDSAAAGLTPACTPTLSEMAFVIWDGTKWWNFVGLGA